MPIELITERNVTAGLHVPFVYINDITNGLFIKTLLFAVWCIVTFGIYFTQKRNLVAGDFPMALAVSGIITVILATILRLVEGLVDPLTYAITIIIALASVLFFFFSRD